MRWLATVASYLVVGSLASIATYSQSRGPANAVVYEGGRTD